MKFFVFVLFSCVMAGAVTHAQVSQLITHQGYLADSTGQGVNETLAMSFRFFADSTGGATLLELTFSGVQVSKGAYSVALDVSTLSFNKLIWLETEVNAEILSPRTRLTSVPYALTAVSLLGPNSEATGIGAIAGGINNKARGDYSVVSGGGGALPEDSNSANGNYSTINGGRNNVILERYGTIGGGIENKLNGIVATVGGGYRNEANENYSTIGGGHHNIANGQVATVGGGSHNEADGYFATVSGGLYNIANEEYATIGGGWWNQATEKYSTVGGGTSNFARGQYSVVSGGGGYDLYDSNSAIGEYSTIPGGRRNKALGKYSFAAGWSAQANHDGTFVWADSTGASGTDFTSTAPNQFLIRASGGVGIGTASPENTLHVFKNSAGSVTAYGNAPLVVENNANNYIHILSPAANEQGILFGDPAFSVSGALILNSSNEMDFRAGGNSTRMLIDADGNLAIGTTTPDNILTVKQSSTTDPIADAWTTYSSRRWKTDIETLEGALEKVEKLRGVSYKEKSTGKECIGLIAEEVGAVIPEVVEFEENGLDAKSVDYARLVSVLIEAMKEQQVKIEKLTQEVHSQEVRLKNSGISSLGDVR